MTLQAGSDNMSAQFSRSKRLGWADSGFEAIQAMGVERCHREVDFAVPDACFVMMTALSFGSTEGKGLPCSDLISMEMGDGR